MLNMFFQATTIGSDVSLRPSDSTLRLLLVTRGGHPVPSSAAVGTLNGAAIWGLMRTLRLEATHLTVQCTDILAKSTALDTLRVSERGTLEMHPLRDECEFSHQG